jgi:hypothetical protein
MSFPNQTLQFTKYLMPTPTFVDQAAFTSSSFLRFSNLFAEKHFRRPRRLQVAFGQNRMIAEFRQQGEQQP